ncbi:MAG: transglycosylase SLT domain-containing protein [Desulfoferrobacter sp.]
MRRVRIGHVSSLLIAWLVFGILLTAPVRAEFYKYVDQQGVVHLTNIPTQPIYKKIDPSRYCTFTKGSNWIRISPARKIVFSRSKAGMNKSSYDKHIMDACKRHGLDQKLVKAVIKVESAFNPGAISPKGAVGLMQLMPDTSKDLGVSNPFDPVENIDGGVRYLKTLLRRFKNNVPLALAAYNAGPEAVQEYGGIPPYGETQTYVRRVLDFYVSSVR